jgi:hypothetical protein
MELSLVLDFEFWPFEFVSYFGFRASDLAAAGSRAGLIRVKKRTGRFELRYYLTVNMIGGLQVCLELAL